MMIVTRMETTMMMKMTTVMKQHDSISASRKWV